jgi:predicted ATPase
MHGGTDDLEPVRDNVVAMRFELPARLYGRGAELRALVSAFERTAAGAVECVLVSGPSGIGKTATVRALFPLVVAERGYVASGKFDQLRSGAPYAALIDALDELVHQVLAEDEDERARWRDRVGAAIAPNGQLLIQAIPALEWLIGPQPPAIALDAAATQSRFHLTLQRFIQAFATRDRPLVMFLDDMQWADRETTRLLKRVMTSDATEAVLLIETYRDDEASDGHAVTAAAYELGRQRRVTRLELAPLSPADITALVGDTLHRDAAPACALAQLVYRRTAGNPLFARMLLLALHATGHLGYNPAVIERAASATCVADLLAARLRALPAPAQRLLALAAALGHRFELDILALVAESSPAAVHAELSVALARELVVPLGGLEYVAAPGGAGLVFRRLRFQHDQVQRAAYALMSVDEQERTHLRIGELLATAAPGELADRLFDVVAQLDRALALIDTPDRVAALARLNVAAARKARDAAAHAIAIDCLRVAIERLDWTADHREQLEAHAMLAESHLLAGDVKRALAVLDVAAAHTVHNHDRGALDALRTSFYLHANEMKAAVAVTRRAASLFGLVLPDDPAELAAALGATTSGILERIGGRPIEDLIDLPMMADPDALALMKLLRSCLPAAFQLEPALGAFMTAQMVLLSLEHGTCPESAHAYSALGGGLHDTELHPLSYRFGKLGVDLIRRLDERALQPSVECAFAAFVSPWHDPIEHAIAHLRAAARTGREVADHIHAGNAAVFEIAYRVFRGAEPLSVICRDARAYRRECLEVGDPGAARLLGAQIDRLRVLMHELESLTVEEPDPDLTLVATREEANTVHQFFFLSVLVDVTYSTDEEATALDLAITTRQLEPSMPRLLVVVEHRFYHSLAAAAMCRRRPDRCGELAATIEDNQRELERWVTACPANFEAMYLVVEAERSRMGSDLEATLARYDQAAASAARHGQRRLEALAHELHGQLWADRGKPEIAQIYVARARNLYAALGAYRKVQLLERKHPAIVRGGVQHRASTPTGAPPEHELARQRARLEELVAELTRELALATRQLREASADRERIAAELRIARGLDSVRGRLD